MPALPLLPLLDSVTLWHHAGTRDHGPPTVCPLASCGTMVMLLARAVGGIVPQLHGELGGLASRVSTLSGSVWL